MNYTSTATKAGYFTSHLVTPASAQGDQVNGSMARWTMRTTLTTTTIAEPGRIY
ncbi:MAG TPA: hypothetical protein VHX16_15875 [Chloroflexota bacterium]|nr:hypothetical protein [Chloroflexota bacterium]